jgi:glutamate synthase (NADPH/NADH) small chain
VKENKAMSWPNWPLKLRTSSSHEEGVAREFAVLTKRCVGENGVVTGLECVRVEWEGGKMVEVPGSEFTLKADLILLAMGFVGRASGSARSGRRDAGRARQCEGRHQHLSHQRRQDLCLRRHAPWSVLVVWAIREGRQAARAVDEALMGVTELPR